MVIEGSKATALIDTGAQVATIAAPFVKELGLEIYPMQSMLKVEAAGGGLIPYEGYVEVELSVPGLENFKMDTLMLVIAGSKYTEAVPIQLGTLQIDEIMKQKELSELRSVGKSWERAFVSREVANRQAQVLGQLDQVKANIKVSKRIVIPPFETVSVRGCLNIQSLSQGVNVVSEGLEMTEGQKWEFVPSYGLLEAGSSRLNCQIRNRTSDEVVIGKKTKVGKCCAGNVVPPMFRAKGASTECSTGVHDDSEQAVKQCEVSPPDVITALGYKKREWKPSLSVDERKTKLLNEIDLKSIEDFDLEEQIKIKDLLGEYHDIFCLEDLELGHTNLIKHKIVLKDPEPFKERYRRIPPHLFSEVKKHVQEMLDIGVIRPSNSPYASAAVLVRKKDGSLRFCIDLRKLNSKSVKDAYSIPRIEETLDCLDGAKYFTSLDLKAGYWQVELEEESKPLTAFTLGPLGFWEMERLPFGAQGAVSAFQRLMETCLGELHLNWCLLYLDDIVVFSKSVGDHIVRLRAVFEKLRKAGLKLKPKKCELFKTRLKYLGHIVSAQGIETDPEKVKCILDWPRPKTITELRSFLGFTNYYRKFLKGYAAKAKDLNKLLTGEQGKHKNAKIPWEECHEVAFNNLKELCATAPVLKYADYKKVFRLHTDASFLGLGAVLYQEDQGVDRVVAYASRSLSGSEQKYDAHKLEFLALKWAVTEKFHDYLYGGKFEVHTDNNPLTYILTTAKLDATGQRWVASLANYDFSLHYRSGKQNIDADSLSRIDWNQGKIEDCAIENEVVQAVVKGCTAKGLSLAELYVSPDGLEVNSMAATVDVEDFSKAKWKKEQEADPHFGALAKREVLSNSNDEKADLSKRGVSSEYLKQMSMYRRRDGLLYRVVKSKGKEGKTWQFLLPEKYWELAIKSCHDDMGHLGRNRVLALLQDRFYWPKMQDCVEKHLKSCGRCLRFKTRQDRAPLKNICVTRPMELVHIDFLTIESGSTGKDVNVLVVTDHFTRYAQAYVTPSQKAGVVAKTLWEKFFVNYGFPEYLLSDQGRNFESELLAELCSLVQVKKLRTTPYRPQTNGQCEKYNSTLISMIGCLPIDKKKDWQSQVSTLAHAYNSTCCEVTGYSPFYLMYGRESLLPLDIRFKVRNMNYWVLPTKKFVKRLKSRMGWAYSRAREMADADAKKHKRRYDLKCRGNKLQVGDMVLVRELAFRGKHKTQDRWRRGVYKVIQCMGGDYPVYRVQEVGNEEVTHVLHRNYLYPLQVEAGELSDCERVGDVSVEGEEKSEAQGPKGKDDPQDPVKTDMSLAEDKEAEPEGYRGPLTRSRAKPKTTVQAKAVQLISPNVERSQDIVSEKGSIPGGDVPRHTPEESMGLFLLGFAMCLGMKGLPPGGGPSQ